ncbi:hypothetical protein STIUS_v1c00250 [Spiroplasma sp. TIUS-1]|uniref:lipoprotein n=1 Tax=Spiroplasma sp. TIUS-1 TaxID=216963 RepID=UPI001397D242|nr:lipoprotein [Spiroplasma sp. TIUS-1]QHX35580.1 hypothetical protein STIUS_v1c00250 [Spiroplasma sp. TIUS-1]
MKKLISLIGAITLTTSVAAVSVVSCGMRTNSINFTINGKNYDKTKDWRGQPQNLMMNILELLTFDKRKYTNEVTANKVLETLGENAELLNLYKLTYKNKKYEDLNKRLNSINNDGIKSFDFNWGQTSVDEETNPNVIKGTDLKFTVITQEYDNKNNGSKPIVKSASPMSYDAVVGDSDIWGENEDEAKKLKDKFTSLYKEMEFTIIGNLPSGMPDPGVIIKEITEEQAKDRIFNDSFDFNFIKKDTKENEPENYLFDALQATNTKVGDFKTKIGFGDLNGKQKNDIDIELEIKNTELVLSPSVIAGKTVVNDEDKKTTKTYIMTWLPSVYSYVSTYKNLVEKKNIFEKADISLI